MAFPSEPAAALSDLPWADQQLADLLGEIVQKLRAGESVDLDAVIAAHPHYAKPLGRLLPAMTVLADFGTVAGFGSGAAAVAHDAEVLPGILGDFRIIRVLGRGGMGVVYEAEQLSLNRRVALKILPTAGVLDPRTLQRFRNEAQAAAALDHPHIVDVYGVGCERGVHYYAMRRIDGCTLAEVIAQLRERAERAPHCLPSSLSQVALVAEADRPTEVQESDPTVGAAPSGRRQRFDQALFRSIAELGMHVAEALDHAHQQGVIHRDIKPSNLMLDGQGKVWITDFGLAQIEHNAGLTLTGDVLGTLRYMSPEAASGQRPLVDHRTDVYSLGASLYELLARRPAIDGDDHGAVLRAVVEQEPAPLRTIDRSIPAELETIVHKALAKERDQRYPSMADLADDLRRFLEHRPIRARRPGPVQHVRKWLRRNSGLIVTLAMVVALASLTASWLVSRKHAELVRQRNEAQRLEGIANDQTKQLQDQKKQLQNQTNQLLDVVFASQLKLAWQLYGNGEPFDEVLKRLAEQNPTRVRDDFAWRYLWGLRTPSRAVLQGHQGDVYYVAYSPRGDQLASASKDHTIRLWNAADNQLLHVLSGHTNEVNNVSYSSDGKWLASAGDDRTVRMWNAATGELVRTFDGFSNRVSRVEFQPGGPWLAASVFEKHIEILDSETGRRAQILEDPLMLAFSPDGRLLACATRDKKIRVWSTADWSEAGVLASDVGFVRCAAFSPNGELLAGGCQDNTYCVWSIPQGRVIHRQSVPNVPQDVAFSRDGAYIACATNAWEVTVFGGAGATRENPLPHHSDRVWAVVYSPDGQTLASASRDRTIRLWPAKPTPRYVILPRQSPAVQSLGLSPDGAHVAAAHGDALLRVWGAATETLIREQSVEPCGEVVSVCYSPDRRWLAVGGMNGWVALLDAQSFDQVAAWPAHAAPVDWLAFSRDSRLLMTDDNRATKVWDLTSRTPRLRYATHRELQSGLRLALDGVHDKILMRHTSQVLARWEPATGQLAHTNIRGTGILATAYSHDGALVANSLGRWIEIRDLRPDSPPPMLVARDRYINSLAFSPDGRLLASSSTFGPHIQLWDVHAQQDLFTLETPFASVNLLQFSDQANMLAAASATTGEIILWRAPAPP